MMNTRQKAGAYFILQGISVALWWAMLWLKPEMRTYFVLERTSETSLLAFWPVDITMLALGSLVSGVLFLLNNRHAHIPATLVAGSFGYAVLYTLGFALMTDTGWLGVLLMSPAAIWSGIFALAHSSLRDLLYTEAKPTSTAWILVKTFIQIVVVWILILAVFPYFITIIEAKLAISQLTFTFQRPLAIIIFVLISMPGVLAAITMAKIGEGTPLPLDSSRKLVAKGVYSYVRNPMAISGIGQGLAVALFFGSPLVALYALMGSMIWQHVFRPIEEEGLEAKFGDEYRDYRAKVKCWVPNLGPYSTK